MIILAIAWRGELICEILYILIGIILNPFIFIHNYRMNNSFLISFEIIAMITFPFILSGTLCVLSHFRKKNISLQ